MSLFLFDWPAYSVSKRRREALTTEKDPRKGAPPASNGDLGESPEPRRGIEEEQAASGGAGSAEPLPSDHTSSDTLGTLIIDESLPIHNGSPEPFAIAVHIEPPQSVSNSNSNGVVTHQENPPLETSSSAMELSKIELGGDTVTSPETSNELGRAQ